MRTSRAVTLSDAALPVLIVDDDEPTQTLLRALLRRCGYTTDVAANGAQAIERLQGNAYAAVILDVMMPGVGGAAVVEFLRTAPRSVPVIICSAAGPAALSGFDPRIVKAIVRKPFDVDQFVAAVTSVVETSEARPLRVLIIDDDMRARYTLAAFLDADAVVTEAEHGDPALARIAEIRPDVVLLDLILPGTPGEEMLRSLREHDVTRTTPVVVVTSRALDPAQTQLLIEGGASSVIYKGVLSRETLRAALDSALGRSRTFQ